MSLQGTPRPAVKLPLTLKVVVAPVGVTEVEALVFSSIHIMRGGKVVGDEAEGAAALAGDAVPVEVLVLGIGVSLIFLEFLRGTVN